jgi:hypothetical protein
VLGDRTGERADESRSIVTDDREYECRHDSESRTMEAPCDTRSSRLPGERGQERDVRAGRFDTVDVVDGAVVDPQREREEPPSR